MEEKRIYYISVESTPENNGEIYITNFMNLCAFDFKANDAYIMVDKAVGVRANIGVLSFGIYCDGLKDNYNFHAEQILKNSKLLDIVPATMLIRSVDNAVLSNAYFNISNQLDNWRHISINDLNNIHLSIVGLSVPTPIDFNMDIVIKIKLIKRS